MEPTLQERLAEVMALKNWTHADLMRVTGQSSSVVSQWLGKGSKIIKTIGKFEAAEAIEKESGFSALWVAKGIGPKLRSAQILKNEDAALLAQAVIHRRPIIPLRNVTWRDLPVEQFKEAFSMQIETDALLPDCPRGSFGTFRPGAPPQQGRPVLVRDRSGQFHLRFFQEGALGRWQGVAKVSGFEPLDSDAHGLEIMAPMTEITIKWGD